MIKNIFISERTINPNLLNKESVYILSTNINAKNIFFLLLQYQVQVSGFVVKEKRELSKLYSLQVFTLEEVDAKKSIFVVSEDEWDLYYHNVDEQRVYLVKFGSYDQNEFTFEEKGNIRKCNAALMLTMILSRVQKKQAVFLVKSQDYGFWYNLSIVLKDELKDAIIISADTNIDQIFDLMYLSDEKLIVFIAFFEYMEIEKILIDIGLKKTKNFVNIVNSFSGNVTDKYFGFDWLLGNTFIGNEKKSDTPKAYYGFSVHGNLSDVPTKIVLLGNSATDPLFYPQKSWPEMLWEELKKCQINITIYNGAVTDYNSTNEVIKLFRDVLLLKPDIVLSYSGIIDFRQYVQGYPYLNLNLMRTSKEWENANKKEVIYGLEDYRPAYERWLENEKIMHQICKMNGISFFGILQPWLGSDSADACEKLQVWSNQYWQLVFPQFEQYIDNAREFKVRIQKDAKIYDWLYDFTNIFSKIDDADIFFDSVHVNEEGNRVIALEFEKLLRNQLREFMAQ